MVIWMAAIPAQKTGGGRTDGWFVKALCRHGGKSREDLAAMIAICNFWARRHTSTAHVNPSLLENSMSTAKPFGLAVKAIVSDEQGRILLIRRSLESKNFKHKWDLPGGKVDPGESFDQALLREVEEETGLVVAITGVAGATEFEMAAVRVAVLILEVRSTGGTVRLSSEHDQFAWAPRAEVAGMDLSEQLRSFLIDYCR